MKKFIFVHKNGVTRKGLLGIKALHEGATFTIALPADIEENQLILPLSGWATKTKEVCEQYCIKINTVLLPIKYTGSSQKQGTIQDPAMQEAAVKLGENAAKDNHYVIIPVIEIQIQEMLLSYSFNAQNRYFRFPEAPDTGCVSFEHVTNLWNAEQSSIEFYGEFGVDNTHSANAANNSINPQNHAGEGASTHYSYSKRVGKNTKKTTWYGTILGISCILAAGGAYLAKFEQLNTVQAVALVLAALLLPNLLYVAYEKGCEIRTQPQVGK